ncbi:MAG: hypothetical protein RR290_00835 [Clostridia bacterium]
MKKGISLIALVVTIVIAIILVSTAVVSYDLIITNSKKSEFSKEMYSLLKLVKDYEFINNEYPLLEEISIPISVINASEIQQFAQETQLNGSIKLWKIDLAKSGVKEIKRGLLKTKNDMYVFSKSTQKIYYINGEKIGNNTYYTLTDELYKMIGINEVN